MYRRFLHGSPWSGWLEEQSAGDLRERLASELRLAATERRPTRRARRRYAEDFWHYCLETQFADVEQGIVVRDAGGLRRADRPVPATVLQT
jgi:hypothetical protein